MSSPDDPQAEIAKARERERLARARLDALAAERYTFKVADKAAQQRFDADMAAARPKPVIRNGAWLNSFNPPPLTWAVWDLFPEGVSLIAGPPKSGKSWLSLSLSLSAVTGTTALGGIQAQEPRPLLYFGLEDSDRRMKERSAMIGFPMVPELFYYATEADPAAVLETIRDFFAHYARYRPICWLDTWGALAGPALRGEGAYDRDYRLGRLMKECADGCPGASLLINHHTRKEGAADFVERVSGTFGVTGSCDTIALLTRKRGETSGQLQITGRDVTEQTLALGSFPGWVLVGGSVVESARAGETVQMMSGLSERTGQVLAMVIAKGEVMTQEVALSLGMTVDTASTYLGRLEKSGKIKKSSRGKWESIQHSQQIENPGWASHAHVPTVGSVESVGNENTSNSVDTGTRGRARAEDWWILEDGRIDWNALWVRFGER